MFSFDKVICIFKGIHSWFIMLRLSVPLHIWKPLTMTWIAYELQDTITDDVTHHTLLSSRKNVCKTRKPPLLYEAYESLSSLRMLELRLQHLIELISAWWKSAWFRGLSVRSFCLSLPRVCFGHRQSLWNVMLCFLHRKRKNDTYIYMIVCPSTNFILNVLFTS